MGHIDVSHVSQTLSDGRPLLDDITFRVGEGAKVALVGANGAGKTTLLRMVAGDIAPEEGVVGHTGGMGVMRQFVGRETGETTVRDLLVSVSTPALKAAVARLDAAELAMMESDSEKVAMAYAHALGDYGDAGGYDAEVFWDVCCQSALGVDFEAVRYRVAESLSGGERKRLVLEALLRGPDEVLLLDEPDNYLDVPTKRWLEAQLQASPKTVLFVSHDRELLRATATTIASLELGAAGSTLWLHGGGFATFAEARADRFARLEELRKRWDEERAKLKQLVLTLKTKSAFNDGLASRYSAAVTRLNKFEAAGPPMEVPVKQTVKMRLKGGRTGKRAVVCEQLEMTGLTQPFDLEVWFGERIGVLGANGAGKSHFLRLLAAGGTDPLPENQPVEELVVAPVAHSGVVRLGARVRPGWFAQTHVRPDLAGKTLLEALWRGDDHRAGMGREQAARALDRYGLAHAGEQTFGTLSGGQQARFQILLLELSGATLLLLDEPTDNLDLESAEALEEGLDMFEGTVVAVTHDRWFARGFDRFIHVGPDGVVRETTEPVWS